MTVLSSFPPRFFWINSGISRPLSPMSAMTLTGAFEFLTIIPIKVDLPTPLPAKIPSFCPTPQVKSPSIVLTPVGKISSIKPLFIASMGERIIGINLLISIAPLPSFGFIKGSTTRPKSASLTPICIPASLKKALSPILKPSMKEKGLR